MFRLPNFSALSPLMPPDFPRSFNISQMKSGAKVYSQQHCTRIDRMHRVILLSLYCLTVMCSTVLCFPFILFYFISCLIILIQSSCHTYRPIYSGNILNTHSNAYVVIILELYFCSARCGSFSNLVLSVIK